MHGAMLLLDECSEVTVVRSSSSRKHRLDMPTAHWELCGCLSAFLAP